MPSYSLNNMAITTEKDGYSNFTKRSYPIRFGEYTEIRSSDYEFHFNLKGEIKFIRGLGGKWPHPSEWLKRSDGNDWAFYSVGSVNGYKGVFNWLGEYYLPCLTYSSNAIWEFNPFSDMNIMQAFAAWSQLYANLRQMNLDGTPSDIKDFLNLIARNDETALYEESKKLHSIIGSRLSVLPPDARHSDYEVIPIIIADGCLYHCDFCSVKSQMRFQRRTRDDIRRQIQDLKTFYGRNVGAYNAVFLGNHDALAAGEELILTTLSEAVDAFGFNKAAPEKPKLYLFGSVDSFLKAGDNLLNEINRSPFYTYINLGFESVDPSTLAMIKKPLDASKIRDAFGKMLDVNRNYEHVDVTANFLLGEDFPIDHINAVIELLSDVKDVPKNKGTVYLSPLLNSRNRLGLLQSFFDIQKQSKPPAYIYLIQRL